MKPEFVEGKVENESSFLLCSDGFWHKITELEIYQALSNSKWNSKGQIEEKTSSVNSIKYEAWRNG